MGKTSIAAGWRNVNATNFVVRNEHEALPRQRLYGEKFQHHGWRFAVCSKFHQPVRLTGFVRRQSIRLQQISSRTLRH